MLKILEVIFTILVNFCQVLTVINTRNSSPKICCDGKINSSNIQDTNRLKELRKEFLPFKKPFSDKFPFFPLFSKIPSRMLLTIICSIKTWERGVRVFSFYFSFLSCNESLIIYSPVSTSSTGLSL